MKPLNPEFLKQFNQYKMQRDFINLVEWELSKFKNKTITINSSFNGLTR